MMLSLIDVPGAWRLRGTDPAWAGRCVQRFRDLLLFDAGGLVFVVACDSNAGVGPLAADVITQPSRATGYGASKVPMMEVLAAGATPMVLVNNLGVALGGEGSEVLAGIRDCIEMSGTQPVLTGSDESNVPTSQSAVGVTVIGVAGHGELLLGQSRPGDIVVAIGVPRDGIIKSYEESDPDVATPREARLLAACGGVHELLPVGSRGVGHEASELARTSGLTFVPANGSIDFEISAGSSTCMLAACHPDHIGAIRELVPQPVTAVGHLAAGCHLTTGSSRDR